MSKLELDRIKRIKGIITGRLRAGFCFGVKKFEGVDYVIVREKLL